MNTRHRTDPHNITALLLREHIGISGANAGAAIRFDFRHGSKLMPSSDEPTVTASIKVKRSILYALFTKHPDKPGNTDFSAVQKLGNSFDEPFHSRFGAEEAAKPFHFIRLNVVVAVTRRLNIKAVFFDNPVRRRKHREETQPLRIKAVCAPHIFNCTVISVHIQPPD
jgi:hypothetical protein